MRASYLHWKLRIWSHLLKKSLMESFIFSSVKRQNYVSDDKEIYQGFAYKILNVLHRHAQTKH